tara:strand:+ start:4187 stop:4462 length:276 start_codon:yes stop_codon:yes gene_type:complete
MKNVIATNKQVEIASIYIECPQCGLALHNTPSREYETSSLIHVMDNLVYAWCHNADCVETITSISGEEVEYFLAVDISRIMDKINKANAKK